MAKRDDSAVPQRALVAAARRVKLSGKAGAAELGRRQEWQPEAWAMWRAVPEVKQAMLFLGNAFAKLRLFVATYDPTNPEGAPIPVSDEASPVDAALAAAAEAELDRLVQRSDGGISELLRSLDLQLEIPGEGFLVGLGARAVGDPDPRPGRNHGQPLKVELPEVWSIRSISEVEVKDQGTFIKGGPQSTDGRRLALFNPERPDDPAFDTVIRLWVPDPEWRELADSPMQGVLGECRLLLALSNQQLAVANSQMHAGILTVPNELSFGPATPTDGEDGQEAPEGDPFQDELDRSFMEPVADPEALGTVRPMLVRGPGEYLQPQYLRFISMGRQLDATLDARIETRVRRISRGLNLPVEVVEGHMATTFSNAEQIDQDLFDDHLEPRCRLGVDSLTGGYLHPNLTDDGRDGGPFDAEAVRQVFIWYDPSALVRQPDTEGNADQAHKNFTISDAAYRRAKGYGDDDAPDALELIIRAGMSRGILTAELTAALLQKLADEAGVELPSPEALAPGAGGAPADPGGEASARVLAQALALRDAITAAARPAPTAALRAAPPSNAGRQLVDIDRDLRTRLEVASSAAMDRTLERAGNRLRSRLPQGADREQLTGLRPRQFAQHLGRARVELAVDPAGLLDDDAWAELEAQFMEWGAAAQADATEVAYSVVGGFTTAERADLGLRQADQLADAWTWMEGALRSLATARLFDPDPAAPDIGEFDPTARVPTGLIRQAMARAGGAAGLTTNSAGGAYVTLTDGGTRPAGGIALGDTIRGVLRDGGVQVEGYQWVYGPAQRRTNFQPHLSLDGTTFRNFDDPVLANGSGFPAFDFYLPGDHAGCRCDVMPVLLAPPAAPQA